LGYSSLNRGIEPKDWVYTPAIEKQLIIPRGESPSRDYKLLFGPGPSAGKRQIGRL
jgi:hypothetical protein